MGTHALRTDLHHVENAILARFIAIDGFGGAMGSA
jgi:hypothetical protein